MDTVFNVLAGFVLGYVLKPYLDVLYKIIKNAVDSKNKGE